MTVVSMEEKSFMRRLNCAREELSVIIPDRLLHMTSEDELMQNSVQLFIDYCMAKYFYLIYRKDG